MWMQQAPWPQLSEDALRQQERDEQEIADSERFQRTKCPES